MFCVLFILSFESGVLYAGPGKSAVTESQVTGSVFDLLKQKDNLEAENAKLRSWETSKWLVVNQTVQVVQVTFATVEQAVSVPARGSKEAEIKSNKLIKPGDRVNVTVGGSPTMVELKAGGQNVLASGVKVRVDFLSGSGAWFILVTE